MAVVDACVVASGVTGRLGGGGVRGQENIV